VKTVKKTSALIRQLLQQTQDQVKLPNNAARLWII